MSAPPGGDPGAPRCGRCDGIGFVYVDMGGREGVKPCTCRRPAEGATREDPTEACCIPPAYRACTLGNFAPRAAGPSNAYAKALAYCQQFLHSGMDDGLGLLFWGASGTGKTHLAVGILKELVANKGVRGRFWDFVGLYREIRRCYDKSTLTTESTTLQQAMEIELLVLDDLGSQRIPDWAHNTLFEIVNARYMARRATLVTTRFEDVDRDRAVHADPMRREEYLIERIGQRVRSRLLEMCTFVPMHGGKEPEAPRRPQRPSTLRGLRRAKQEGRS